MESSSAQGDTLCLPSNEMTVQNHEPLVQLTATLPRRCVKGCPCQCHSPASRTRPHPAALPICGWLKSAYNMVPRPGAPSCDVPTCRRSHPPVRVNLRFPLLFCSRTLETTLSFDSTFDVGASLHLRVGRVPTSNDDIWWEIHYSKIERVRWHLLCRNFNLFDHDPFSDNLLRVS
ncbi:hypothetical protein F4804DRAFT_80557 [Jackrogersella minutella]|nr:hypothetical protein F4804DRAFT_80557 [Jackrogersella minutella]